MRFHPSRNAVLRRRAGRPLTGREARRHAVRLLRNPAGRKRDIANTSAMNGRPVPRPCEPAATVRPPPPHLRRRKNPCRLIRFKKNGAQILKERFNNGRHVWWVAAPDGAQMELIEKASDGAAPQLYPRQWRTGRRVISPGSPR